MTWRRAMTRVFGHPVTWLVLLVLIFFYKEVFLGRVFSPADLLFDFQPWSAQPPPTYQHAANPLRVDEAFIFLPRRLQLARDVSHFGLSLWQDHNFAGTPNTFSINFLGALVYPPMWSYLFLSPGLANTLLHLPIPLIAALCMYLLLGRLTRYRLVRLLGAIAWGLNGYFVVWLSAFFLPLTLAVLPLLLYLALRFLDDRRLWAGLVYALLLGWTFFLGYPPANIIIITLLGIYFLAWLGAEPRARAKPFLSIAGLSLLALGVGGLPIVTGIVELSRLVGSRGTLSILPYKDLQTFLFPNVFGNPIAQDWRSAQGNYCEYVAYFGSIPLILAIAGGFQAIARRAFRIPLILASIATGIATFAIAYQVWPASLLQHVPLYGDVAPARWHIGVVFAGVMLATYALDAIVSGKLSPRLLVIATAVVVAGAGVILLVHRHDLVGADHFIRNDEILRVALLGAGVAALLSVLRFRATLPLALLAAILALDLVSFGTGFNPALRPAEFYPTPPALAYLQAHAGGYRVMVARKAGLLWPGDALSVYGIDSITGYDHFRDATYVGLLGPNISIAEKNFWRQTGYLTLGQALDLDSPVFNLLSVRYVLYPDEPGAGSPPASSHWQQVYAGSDGRILENLQALPRQFVVPAAGDAPLAIDHTALRPDQDRLTAPGPARLVWSKPYSRDWQVTVDGHPATTAPFSGYFLSVGLAAGVHRVALVYQPADYLAGSLISLASLAIIAAVAVVARRRRGR
jgi:hypothetical protein